jgi:O-antigen/teichoic acid export membrane protein
MIQTLRRQASGLDLRFLTSTTVLTVGIALARLFGFGFSLILARTLTPDQYGFIQYSITLGGVIAIGTMPFMQHVMARFIGKYKAESEELLAQYMNTFWWMLMGVVTLSIVIAVPVLALSGKLHLGAMIVFLGMTLFYSYYGLARGHMASYRLMIAYLGSNVIQVIAIFVVYYLLQNEEVMPALLIYGLSYLVPIVLLQIFSPLPLFWKLSLPPRDKIMELVRFATPVWVSHIAYTLYSGIDVLLLERYAGTAALGAYALSKTLSMLLSFVPIGLNTILLPKAAATPREQHGKLLRQVVVLFAVANFPFLVLYLLGYQFFVRYLFGHDYVVGFDVILMLALGEVLYGLHGIITAVVVGGNRPQLETVSRILTVIVVVVVGSLAIPAYGITGAAFTVLISGIIAVGAYALALLLERNRKTHDTVQV